METGAVDCGSYSDFRIWPAVAPRSLSLRNRPLVDLVNPRNHQDDRRVVASLARPSCENAKLGALLNVTRQAVSWFKPTRPDTVALGRFPIFILDRGPNDVVYGFPDFEQRGVKAAPHNHGPMVGPDDWGPQATEAELRPVGDALAALVPGAAGPIIDRDVCLYTNTVPADRLPDAGEDFIIDRWPDSRLIVCSACSGHGAKFAPAIGQRLARLATDPSYEAESFFQLSRYSQFA